MMLSLTPVVAISTKWLNCDGCMWGVTDKTLWRSNVVKGHVDCEC